MKFKHIQPWIKEVETIASIHYHMQVYHGIAYAGRIKRGWSQRDTAKLLEISVGTVNEAIKLAELVKTNPNLVIGSKAEALKCI